MYDVLMQRWHVSFDYIEEHWTPSQFFSLLAMVIEEGRERKRTEYKARHPNRMSEAELQDKGLR